MAYAFVHVSPDKAGKKPALDKHNRGETRPPEAMTREEWDHLPAIRIAGYEDRAAEVLEEIGKTRGRGRPGCERVRFMFGHPPPFEAEDAWDRDRLLSWARDSAAWLETKIGQSSNGCAVLERVDLHLDETTPHLHASIVPAMPKRPQNPVDLMMAKASPAPEPSPDPKKLSWNGLQRTMFRGVNRAQSMRDLQDSYHSDVGRRYGMKRGESSSRTRAEPDRMDGLQTRVRLAEKRADREAQKRVNQVEREAKARVERGEQHIDQVEREAKARVERGEKRADREAQKRIDQVEQAAQARVERVEQRARQQGRAAAADRDGPKSKVARVQHDARAARAENRQLRDAAYREGRGRR